MPELSNAESALLGLLSEGPMHPYQIEQEVQYRDMRFWTELSMSAIYKLLRKLEKQGYVLRKDEISAENRLRKLYTISDRGRKELQKKLKSILSEPEHIRWQFDIGIYNSDLLPPEDVRNVLSDYRKALEKNIEGYEALLKFLIDTGCPEHRLSLAIRPKFLLEAEIKWLDSFLDQMK